VINCNSLIRLSAARSVRARVAALSSEECLACSKFGYSAQRRNGEFAGSAGQGRAASFARPLLEHTRQTMLFTPFESGWRKTREGEPSFTATLLFPVLRRVCVLLGYLDTGGPWPDRRGCTGTYSHLP
jgi:hypothetical protein